MCILFMKLLKAAKQGEFKLILASNRDEFFKRPGKIAHFWEEDNNIFGGRDMTEGKQGGTWLAMSKTGRIGVLLDLTGEGTDPNKMGRGFLVANYLKSPLKQREYLDDIIKSGDKYNKFHFITGVLGSQPSFLHYSNGIGNAGVTEIDSETFAIGNSTLKSPFQKVTKGKQRFEEIVEKYGEVEKKDQLVSELLKFLKWEEKHYPDEIIDSLTHLPLQHRPYYGSIFVNMPEIPYGTRTHTIILVDWKGKTEFHEWTLKDPITPQHMEWTETHEQFNLSSDSNTKL